MALIDKASLLMVPSVYEDGTLYNVLPSGNKAPDETGNHNGYDQTRADFTFSRGSNLAATRVNANGLIEKGRENLLLQSNQFDTTWSNSNTTETSGQTDKDGGTDAWLLEKSAVAGAYIAQTKSTSGVNTASVYVKAGTLDVITLWCNQVGGGNPFGTFNLTTETLDDSGTIIASSITSVGNGWYRVSITFSVSTTLFRIYVDDFSNTTAGSIYIQNAQLEYGLAASSYLDSGATTATAGVLENTPRIDYSSGAGALLLEPQRTNSYLHSDYLYNFNGTETFNYATSPEGVQNATLLTKTSASDQFLSLSWSGTTISASSDYTMSIFVKHNGDDVNVRYEYNNSNDWGAVAWTALFEVRASGVTASTVGNCTSDVEDYGDGWYRLKVFVTSGASITASSPANLFRVIGANGESVLVYGAQMEKGSHVSSYVPTYGSAATRGADLCENATASTNIFGASKGAFYIEGYVNTLDTNGIIPFTAGTGTSALMYVWIRTNGTLYVEWYESGVLQAQLNTTSGAVNVGDSFKIAAAYQNNDFVAYLNGTLIETDTNGTAPNPTSLKLGQYTSGAYKGGALSKVYVFNERLSNTELAALTA